MRLPINTKRSATAPQYIALLILTVSVLSVVLQLSFLDSLCHEETSRRTSERDKAGADKRSISNLRQTRTGSGYSQDGNPQYPSPQNHNATTTTTASLPSPFQVSRPTRVLVGIFTIDDTTERRCRHRQRRLFRLHPYTCTLATFLSEQPENCRLIYTFVTGGNPQGPTMQVDSSVPMVIEYDSTRMHFTEKDMLEPDVTLLNIKENMNDGKSQTWFAYGAQLAKTYPIDYIVKQDTDTILFLDKYFDFVDQSLPPAPYNRNILAGSVADKLWWGEDTVNRNSPAEQWAIQRYGGLLHLYTEGQWYLMSPDLAETVQQEAILTDETAKYVAGHEDHDVSAMAFHSNKPIHLIIVSMQQRHWQHRVKLALGGIWHRLWETETNRMKDVVQQTFKTAQ